MRIKKSEIITLRVTPRTKETIRERAKSAGLTVTDYLCYSGLAKEIVVSGAPTKAVNHFCGERRHPGMSELSADQAGSE